MGLDRRVDWWCWATCEVCGAKSPEWKCHERQDEDGLSPDQELNEKEAAGHGYRSHCLHAGRPVMVCGVCRVVLAHRQVHQAEAEGRL